MQPLVPTFITDAVEYGPGQDPSTVKTKLNDTWWASKETADALAERYGAKSVAMPPYYPAPWYRVSFSPASQWYLMFPDGTLINAGLLADYFRRNPEDKFPGVADRYVQQIIAAEEAAN